MSGRWVRAGCLVVLVGMPGMALAADAPAGGAPAPTQGVITDGKFQGQLLGFDGATPYQTGVVELYEGDKLVATARTNAQGIFTFEGVKPGNYRMVAVGQGTGYTGDIVLMPPDKAPKTLTQMPIFEMRTEPVDMILRDGVMEGVIVGPDDKPLEGANVRLYKGDNLVMETTTGEGGAFTFEGLEAGTFRLESDQIPLSYIGEANLWLPGTAPPGALGSARIMLLPPAGLLPVVPFLGGAGPLLAALGLAGGTTAALLNNGGGGGPGTLAGGPTVVTGDDDDDDDDDGPPPPPEPISDFIPEP